MSRLGSALVPEVQAHVDERLRGLGLDVGALSAEALHRLADFVDGDYALPLPPGARTRAGALAVDLRFLAEQRVEAARALLKRQ